MKFHCCGWIAALFLLMPTVGLGQPAPVLNVQRLVDDADVILLGTVQTVAERGSTVLDVFGQRTAAKVLVAEIIPDRTLKGALETPTAKVAFASPDPRARYGPVAAGDYELMFLKRSGPDYGFVSPYYPALPAVAVSALEGNEPADKVANVIAARIESPSSSNRERINAIHALGTLNNSTSIAGLGRALKQPDENVRLSAAAILLELQQLAGLEMVERTLLGDTGSINDAVLHNMRYAISELSVADAAPALVRLLKSPDDLTRRSATAGLRRARSPQAMSALAAALDDRDPEVRYYAVRGLAEMTGESAWGPSLEVFRASEDKYVSYWKARTRQEN